MRHQQYRKAVRLPEGTNQILHFDSRQGVERAQWFIEQEQARTVNQRPRQRNALLLSTRECGRPFIGAIFQPNGGQRLAGFIPPVTLKTEPDIVDNRFPRQQACILEHHAGIVLNIRKRRRSCQNVAAVGGFQSGQQP